MLPQQPVVRDATLARHRLIGLRVHLEWRKRTASPELCVHIPVVNASVQLVSCLLLRCGLGLTPPIVSPRWREADFNGGRHVVGNAWEKHREMRYVLVLHKPAEEKSGIEIDALTYAVVLPRSAARQVIFVNAAILRGNLQ